MTVYDTVSPLGPALSVNPSTLSDSAPPDLPCEPKTGACAALVDGQTVRAQYLLMSILEFLAKMFGKSVNHSERLLASEMAVFLLRAVSHMYRNHRSEKKNIEEEKVEHIPTYLRFVKS